MNAYKRRVTKAKHISKNVFKKEYIKLTSKMQKILILGTLLIGIMAILLVSILKHC